MDLEALRALVAVVDHGSVLAASQVLSVSRLTVRARIETLEKEVGSPLLVRADGKPALTETGRHFLDGARALLDHADSLVSRTVASRDALPGEVRLRVPVGGSPLMFGLFSTEMRRRYPDVRLRMFPCHDPLSEGPRDADVVLYIGNTVPDGLYRTFALVRIPRRAQASRSYLDAAGRPRDLEELVGQHTLVSWVVTGEDGSAWPLLDGGSVPVRPWMVTTDGYAARCMAAAGAGISLVPDSAFIPMDVPGEDLEPVLPDVVGGECILRVLVPERVADLARRKAVTAVMRDLAQSIFGVDLPED